MKLGPALFFFLERNLGMLSYSVIDLIWDIFKTNIILCSIHDAKVCFDIFTVNCYI